MYADLTLIQPENNLLWSKSRLDPSLSSTKKFSIIFLPDIVADMVAGCTLRVHAVFRTPTAMRVQVLINKIMKTVKMKINLHYIYR